MSKPDDIPEDLHSAAYAIAQNIPARVQSENRVFAARVIARAILAERERCAAECNVFDAPVSDSEFVNGQATAAQQIRAAIRKGAA